MHFAVPGIAAKILYKERWKTSWLVMVLTLVVDLDHLLSNPVFDPDRCSIGFHPLHSYYPICIYAIMLSSSKLRIISVGLLIHMLLDAVDCCLMKWP
jgi:hypothetical protein